MNKKLLIAVGAVILIALIIVLNLRGASKGKEIEVAVVKKGEVVTEVSASGELKAKAQVDIAAEIIAKVKKLYFKEGDYVKQGDLIIQFDDVQAAANFKLAEAQRKQADQDYGRIKVLYEKGMISKGEYEQTQLAYQSAQAQYEQALDVYQKTRIHAPISGRIMKINIEEGETAVMGTMNYQGTVLATIADLSRMLAIVKIDETDVPSVAVGQEVDVMPDALPDSTFRGKVVRVGLMPLTTQLSTEKTTDFEVEIEMASFSPVLRPGMNVNANIITHHITDVLVVPVQAIGSRKIKDTLSETAFVMHGGKAHLKKVKIGVSSDTESEILEGLVEGDTVITGPFRILSKLKDSDPVKVRAGSALEKQSVQARSAIRFIKKHA
jgi:HlyD family secretion protein